MYPLVRPLLYLFLVNISLHAIHAAEDLVHHPYPVEMINAYIKSLALQSPLYRTELHVISPDKPIPVGMLEDVSPILGRFSYRPKYFSELSPTQRDNLLANDLFKHFAETYGMQFVITQEELLSPAVFKITLPKI